MVFDVEAGYLLHTLPHVLGVFLLEFALQLFPVGVLTPSQFRPQFTLPPFQLILVTRSEGSLLFIQKSLQVTGDPTFVVGETAHSPGRDNGILTEVDVVSDAICEVVDIVLCGSPSTVQSMVSKQSCRASLAS